jgi:hypothetical protein
VPHRDALCGGLTLMEVVISNGTGGYGDIMRDSILFPFVCNQTENI